MAASMSLFWGQVVAIGRLEVRQKSSRSPQLHQEKSFWAVHLRTVRVFTTSSRVSVSKRFS